MWLKDNNPLPNLAEFKKAYISLSINLKFFVIMCLLIGTTAGLASLWFINQNLLVIVKSSDGEITEGIVGTPRFGNPLLATSDADRDIVNLVYSGLMRQTSSGDLIPDLATKVETSTDGKKYTFYLKPNLVWHDGKPLTTKDIQFTINKVKDPTIKSARRPRWEGVTTEILDDKTIVFHLEQPFAGFLKNTTIGILPAHLWSDIPNDEFSLTDLNTKPVGSGPYEIEKIKKDASSIAEYYLLKPFDRFALGAPKVTINLKLYPNETSRLEAFASGDIDTLSAISPENLQMVSTKNHTVITSPMPRVFGIFFNQNQSTVLAKPEVRQALDISLDKQKIIDKVLFGYGTPIDGPTIFDTLNTTEQNGIEKAQTILEKAGWKKNEAGFYEKTISKTTTLLEFSLTTSDTPELKKVAEETRNTWTKLGAKVDLKVFESGTLDQTVIRPRKYDALLFGQVTGRNIDLYSFWHSSQRLNPGLNIAMYANLKVDKLLEEIRNLNDIKTLQSKNESARELIKDDYPAIFLYTPKFIYIIPDKIKDINFGIIEQPSDRFSDMYKAYIETEKVWKFFANQNNIINQ